MLGESRLIAMAFIAFAFIDAGVSFFLANLMIKHVIPLPGLGDRLDRYANASLVRFALLMSGTIMLLMALYFSGDLRIAIVYGIYLLFFLFAWPTRSRVSSELKLKESEREVIFGK